MNHTAIRILLQRQNIGRSRKFSVYICCVTILLLLQCGCLADKSTEPIKTYSPEQMYELGLQYGKSTNSSQPMDIEKAISWLKKSAGKNYLPATHALGWIYFNNRDVDKNLAEAEKYFRQAAQQGYAESQFMLGLFYAQGWVVKKNSSLSLQWIKKAADQGHIGAQRALKNLFNR